VSPPFGLAGWVRTPDGYSELFSAPGVWYNMGGARVSSGSQGSPHPTLPHAWFSPALGRRILSLDGKWELQGMFVVACRGGYVRGPGGFPVWQGGLFTVGSRGTVRRVDGTTGTPSRRPRGWSYGGARVTVASGVGDGWKDALDQFIQTGECPGDWAIWIDGVQRCEGFGG
jgi:hypothetical protein